MDAIVTPVIVPVVIVVHGGNGGNVSWLALVIGILVAVAVIWAAVSALAAWDDTYSVSGVKRGSFTKRFVRNFFTAEMFRGL